MKTPKRITILAYPGDTEKRNFYEVSATDKGMTAALHAPELMAALALMVRTFNTMAPDPLTAFTVIEKARAALLLAKGGPR